MLGWSRDARILTSLKQSSVEISFEIYIFFKMTCLFVAI